jgi:phage shock protein E
MDIRTLINQSGATIVDVRSREEFMGGHVAGAVNIPLHEVPNRMAEFKNMSQPIILCCASGNRSGQATSFLNANGIECFNGGGWMQVNGIRNTQAV